LSLSRAALLAMGVVGGLLAGASCAKTSRPNEAAAAAPVPRPASLSPPLLPSLPEGCETAAFFDLAALRPLLNAEMLEGFAASASVENRTALASMGLSPLRDLDGAAFCESRLKEPKRLMAYKGRLPADIKDRLQALRGTSSMAIAGATAWRSGTMWTAVDASSTQLVFSDSMDLLGPMFQGKVHRYPVEPGAAFAVVLDDAAVRRLTGSIPGKRVAPLPDVRGLVASIEHGLNRLHARFLVGRPETAETLRGQLDQLVSAWRDSRGAQIPVSVRVDHDDVVVVAELRPAMIKQLFAGVAAELAAGGLARRGH
jgi:hypothetical protein